MATWEDVDRIALSLPETGERSMYGKRGWAVRKKAFAWERPLRRAELEALGDAAPTGDVLGARVEHLGAKEALLGADPGVFFTTPHFDGYPAVLVRLDRIGEDDLADLLGEAWLASAPKRLAKAYLERRPRIATAADAPAVGRLLHDFNAEYDWPTPGPAVLGERLRDLLAGEEMVAILAGEPPMSVALLTFRPSVWDTGPVALLEELYVRPDLRGQGIGGAVLALALEVARERGSERFEINVDEGDTDARRFYERHGFANTEPDSDERILYYHRAV